MTFDNCAISAAVFSYSFIRLLTRFGWSYVMGSRYLRRPVLGIKLMCDTVSLSATVTGHHSSFTKVSDVGHNGIMVVRRGCLVGL